MIETILIISLKTNYNFFETILVIKLVTI